MRLVGRWRGRGAALRFHLAGLGRGMGVRVIRMWVTWWLLTVAIASAPFLKLRALFRAGSSFNRVITQLVIALHGFLGSVNLTLLMKLLRSSRLLILVRLLGSNAGARSRLNLLWTLFMSLLIRLLRAMTFVALLHLLVITVRRSLLLSTLRTVPRTVPSLGKCGIGCISCWTCRDWRILGLSKL